MARDRRARARATAQPSRGARAVPARRRRCRRGRGRSARGTWRCARHGGAAARPARLAVPSAARRAVRLLPDPARQRHRRDLAFFLGLLSRRRRHAAGPHLLPVSRVRRSDGARADRRRRVCVHGRVGDDGARVVLPRDDRPPDPRDSPRRPSLPRHRARRGDRHPAVLRCAARRPRGLHVRRHARGRAHRRVAERGVFPGAVRLRRQGGTVAAAHLAARSAPGRAVAGIRADERRDAEDRDLRAAAGDVRPAARTALVVGRDRARARAADGALRRRSSPPRSRT